MIQYSKISIYKTNNRIAAINKDIKVYKNNKFI